jgi:hypothetical protein
VKDTAASDGNARPCDCATAGALASGLDPKWLVGTYGRGALDPGLAGLTGFTPR